MGRKQDITGQTFGYWHVNKIVGTATLATDEKTLTMLRDMGIKMITCGADFNYIVNGAKATYETLRKIL